MSRKSQQMIAPDQPPNKWAAAVIIAIWLLVAALMTVTIIRVIKNSEIFH